VNPDIPALLPIFQSLSAGGEPLVLATIVETEGSTYRKPGARMLIDSEGNWHGILGGGCFEGDLAERAGECLAGREGVTVEYDMRGESDLLWGLGLGCDGLVRILLQPLEPAAGYEPVGWLANLVASGRRGVLATLLRKAGDVPAGASLGVDAESATSLGIDARAFPDIAEAARSQLDARRPVHLEVPVGEDTFALLLTPVAPAPHLLIMGAGPDAVPLARMARELHWDVTILDHREALAVAERFPAGCRVSAVEPENLSAELDLATVSAALLMTHNFAADARWLKALADQPPAYVGLLGPARRQVLLLDELDERQRDALAGKTVAPVGLDIGGEMPGSIALAALAEIHARLAGRSAAPLDGAPTVHGDSGSEHGR
jgi:xanthine/CO dehydrogenase XdhC/CoxF family maturation factor